MMRIKQSQVEFEEDRRRCLEETAHITIPQELDKLEGILRDAKKEVSLQTEKSINESSRMILGYMVILLSYCGRLNKGYYDKAVRLLSSSIKVVGDEIAGYQQERLRELRRFAEKYKQQITEPLEAV